MIYSTVGVPSRASEWCERILHRLVGATGSEPATFVADSLEQIGGRLYTDNSRDVVITTRVVDKKLCDLLATGKKRFLVVSSSPEDCVKSQLADHHECFPNAVRRTAQSLSSILPLLNSSQALVLDCAKRPTSKAVADSLVRHFGLDLSEDAIRRSLDGIAERAPTIEEDLLSFIGSADRQDLATRAATASRFGFGGEPVTFEGIMKSVFDPIWAYQQGGALKDFAWHPLLFLLGDAPAMPPVAPLDVTGDSRCLVYGPYLELPKARWTCRLALKIAGEAGAINLRLEAYAGAGLKAVEFPLRAPGAIDVEMSFDSPGLGVPLELRLFKTNRPQDGLLVMGPALLHPET